MSKEMRQLDDDEKKLLEKVLVGRIAELKHLKLMVRYNDFMADEMLESNYLEKKRGYVKQTNEFKQEIKEIEAIVRISEDQLKNGVEVVEDAEVPRMVE